MPVDFSCMHDFIHRQLIGLTFALYCPVSEILQLLCSDQPLSASHSCSSKITGSSVWSRYVRACRQRRPQANQLWNCFRSISTNRPQCLNVTDRRTTCCSNVGVIGRRVDRPVLYASDVISQGGMLPPILFSIYIHILIVCSKLHACFR